jgi:UDP-N-acetylmuramoyl-L-alanyl-D-glutamate--2,6-diaminopimelate ligase
MRLKELLKGCDYTPSLTLPHRGGWQGWGDIDIRGVAYDSREVREGYLFVAIKGERHDGHDFIRDVIKRGATAIVHEKAIDTQSLVNSQQSNPPLPPFAKGGMGGLCFIKVKNSRKALACIANNFYGRPSDRLSLIGITGTNGKTTTTYILKSILESWGKEVGLIGTIQYMIKDRAYPALHTTPESLEFQSLLKDMFLSGCTHIISEVSSHALAQYRVDGTIFKTAVFTNLTRDHLDFHKTMEDYFRTKERLFRELLDKDGTSVINLDDPYGKRLISELKIQPRIKFGAKFKKILTYGLETGADIMAVDIDNSFQGLRFKILFRGRNYDISSHLIGLSNVYNIMSAVGVSISFGVPWQVILEGIEKAGNVTGRFEKVEIGQEFLCIIDYAHSEDALERLIYAAREFIKKSEVRSQKSEVSNTPSLTLLPRGGGQGWGGDFELRTRNSSPRVITVFGCGGDRDRGKRPKMGEVATRLSDFVIITSDNPRSEEPADIIKEIEGGAVSKNYLIESDRGEAIRKAVSMADDGDVVLIAGKGHEDYQEIKGVRYRFNDRDIIEEAIRDRVKVKE